MINTEDKRIWGIHTMDDSLFLNKNVIGIGWKAFGDCSKLEPTREAFKQHYVSVYLMQQKVLFPPAQVCFIVSLVK